MPWPDDLVNRNTTTVVDPRWALPGVLESQQDARDRALIAKNDIISAQRLAPTPQETELLRRRDALMQARQPPPADIGLAKLDEQISMLDRDIQMRLQAKSRLEAQKAAMIKQMNPGKK